MCIGHIDVVRNAEMDCANGRHCSCFLVDDLHSFPLQAVIELIDKALLLVGWSIWGIFLPVNGYFHRKIRVGDTVYGSAAILLAPSALLAKDLARLEESARPIQPSTASHSKKDICLY